MRIALLTSSYPRFPGDGTAPFIQSIAEALVEAGHEIVVVAPYDPLVRPVDTRRVTLFRFRYTPIERWHIMGHARALEADVRLRPLSYLLAPSFLIAAAYHLYRAARSQGSDAIYAHWVIPNGPPAAWVARRLGIPLLISLHGSDIFTARRNPLFGRAARWAFQQAQAVTACSPELREGALALGAPASTRLLAYGADPRVFSPDRRSGEYRARLGLNENDLAIGGLGRMVYKKGFGLLLEAFARVHAARPETKLLLGGEGPLLPELRNQAAALNLSGSVRFTGRIPWDQAPTFLASLDLFVLPSIRDQAGNLDGLPNVLLEAMASGTPVVASDIGGVRLAVEDQASGMIFPAGDAAALATCLVEMANQPGLRARIAVYARQQIEDRLNWQTFATTIVSLLRM